MILVTEEKPYEVAKKLWGLQEKMKENGIENYKQLKDSDLVELSDIKNAYLSTKDESIKRKNMIQRIQEIIRLEKEKQKDKITQEKIGKGKYGREI